MSPPNPDNLVSIVMCRPAPQAMTDDRQVATLRAATWQHTQRNHGHPRNGLVLKLWECDKENHGWREGPPLTVLCESLDPLAGPSPSGKFSSNEKRIQLSHWRLRLPTLTPLAGYFALLGNRPPAEDRMGADQTRLTWI